MASGEDDVLERESAVLIYIEVAIAIATAQGNLVAAIDRDMVWQYA